MNDRHAPDLCPHTADAASYLLGAHDDPAAFRTHASGCAACQTELTRLRPVSEALATATPDLRAPADMRRRVLDRVEAEAALLGAAGAEADRPSRRGSRAARPALALATVSLLAAAALAVALLSSSSSSVHTTDASLAPAGASALLRQGAGHAEVVVTHMPQAPRGKVYEVWLKPPNSPPQPTDALFSVTSDGRGSVNVPASLRHVSEILVTSEPVGGSSHPTSAPLLAFKLAA